MINLLNVLLNISKDILVVNKVNSFLCLLISKCKTYSKKIITIFLSIGVLKIDNNRQIHLNLCFFMKKSL